MFGLGEEVGFDPDAQVIKDAYTGGSDHLKKTYAVTAKYRDERYNRFCAESRRLRVGSADGIGAFAYPGSMITFVLTGVRA